MPRKPVATAATAATLEAVAMVAPVALLVSKNLNSVTKFPGQME
jgi:hypothetical protein